MATPQMRQISSGTASCPLFLTNFSICAGTLTFVAFIYEDNPPSPFPGRTAPEQRSIFTFHKKNCWFVLFFFPSLSKLGFTLLCAAQHRFLRLTLLLERETWNRLHTHTHTYVCTQNTGKVASRWRRRCVCLRLTAARVQWQS